MPPFRQACGAGPVNGWPPASMDWFVRIQAPGLLTLAVTTIWLPLGFIISPLMFAILSGVVLRSGVSRCDLISWGHATWMPANTASVAAMAGSVWRISTPKVRPRAKPNAAYPIGAIPLTPNRSGSNRLTVVDLPRALADAA